MIANLIASRVRGGEKEKPPQAVRRVEVLRWFCWLTNRLLFQVPDYLVTIGASVATAGYMNPEVLAVGRLHNQLVKVAMGLNPIEPASGCL